MELNYTNVYNFEGAFRGMRNPMNSWDRSDSYFGLTHIYAEDTLTDVCDAWIDHENVGRRERGLEEYNYDMENYNEYYKILDKYEQWLSTEGILQADEYDDVYEVAFIGPNDMALAQKLILAGDEHAKFMRQIFVSVDITAPLLWWKEMDTYKVGTTANSTSTMHKLTSKEIEEEDFSFDKDWDLDFNLGKKYIINVCENLRKKYISTKDKRYWRSLIQLLPESYNQTRTWTANYAILRNIYFQRKNHKLIEWYQFCDWIKSLPYSKELIILGDTNEN